MKFEALVIIFNFSKKRSFRRAEIAKLFLSFRKFSDKKPVLEFSCYKV